MSVAYLKIENYKSIRKVCLQLSDINALVGMNGSGKSNTISALKFFYDNMSKNPIVASDDIYDMNNPYSNSVRITVGYDLRRLQKRCKENLRQGRDSRYSKFYNNIIHLGCDDFFELTLIAVRDKKIVWNHPFETRKLLFNLYPMYWIDTRKINLIDWENLWLQIGDVGKLERKEGKEFKEKLKDDFSQYAKADTVYKKIEKLFDENNIKIKQATPKQMAANTANIYFGGSEFEFKDKRLTFFSDGTNSFNYIKSFIVILSLLTEMKMKEPLLILDEPEISLHHSYIDYLCEIIFEASKNVKFIVSTHAARLIKNVLVNDETVCKIYHAEFDGKYTTIRQMISIRDNKERVAITDQHANAFFAQTLVCVEGQTEMELLQNPYLKLLYPFLRHIDVMEGMANDVQRNIIAPEYRGYHIPVLYVIDMDKVMQFDVESRRMRLKRDRFGCRDKYSYTVRRAHTIGARRRIKVMADNCAFRYKMPIFFSGDANLEELKKIIQEYYSKYNYFVMKTTIEGALITAENLQIFEHFFEETYGDTRVIQEMKQNTSGCHGRERLNIYRIFYNGKSDLLMNAKELKKKNPVKIPRISKLYDFLNSGNEEKTGGWVSRWIEYAICYIAEVDYSSTERYGIIKRKMKNKESGDEIRVRFEALFLELSNWMKEIEKRCEGEK